MQILDQVVDAIAQGDVKRIGEVTTRNFEGPLQTIIPWATNRFTDVLIEKCRQRFPMMANDSRTFAARWSAIAFLRGGLRTRVGHRRG